MYAVYDSAILRLDLVVQVHAGDITNNRLVSSRYDADLGLKPEQDKAVYVRWRTHLYDYLEAQGLLKKLTVIIKPAEIHKKPLQMWTYSHLTRTGPPQSESRLRHLL